MHLGGDAARAIPEGIVESEAVGGVLDGRRLGLAGRYDSVGGFLGGDERGWRGGTDRLPW